MRTSIRTWVQTIVIWILLCTWGVVAAKPRPSAQQSTAATTPTQASPTNSPVIPDRPAIEALATKMAGAIDKSKFGTILVFDFVGPATEPEFLAEGFPPPPPPKKKKRKKPNAEDQWPTVSVLGQRLAADFAAALAKSLPGVRVQTWGDLHRTLPSDDYAPDLVRDVTTAWWIAQSHKVDAFVWPDLEQTPNGAVKLQAVCYRVSDEQSLVSLNTEMSSTPAVQQMSETAVHKVWHSDFPTAGQTGYKYPRCEYCPEANYPEEAVADKAQGTVIMEVIVTAEGRADEIRILHALPFGLTDEAISAVQRWRFDPALGPDGKPAAVRQIIEVTFHLFRQ